MATLFDKSGQPVEVDDAHVTQALVSGQLGTDKPTVSVKTRAGEVYSVPTQNLAKFSQSLGGDVKVMSDAEVAQHQAEKDKAANEAKYGSLGQQAKVAAVSALGGATLGASDLALGAILSKEQKEELEKAKAANPYTNIGAGIAGAILPTVLTGGAAAPEEAAVLGGEQAVQAASAGSKVAKALGVVGKAASAPTRGLDALSGLVERGAGALVGHDAESLVGQIAQKAIAKAAGGATTGAIATGAMDIGENAISSDHNLTGEQLLHHMGMGALFGAGLGAAGGVGGTVLEHALAPGEAGESTISSALQKKAAEWQFGATGAKSKEIRALEGHGLSPEEVGRWQLDELAKYTEDGKAPYTRESIAKAAQKAADEAQPKIAESIDSLDRMGAVAQPQTVIDRLRSEIVEPLQKKIDPSIQGVSNRLSGLIDNAEKSLSENPSFRNMFDLRREIDESINWSKKSAMHNDAMTELRKARSIIEDEIGAQGEAQAGPQWLENYNANKKQFRMGQSVADVSESAGSRLAGNNKKSLEDTIIAAHGLSGLAMGHPLALVASLAASVGNHLLKQYGDAVGSRILDHLSRSGALGQTIMPMVATRAVAVAQKNYTSALTRGMAALTSGELASRGPGRPKSPEGDFDSKSRMVRSMLSDPQQHVQQINSQASALGPTFSTVGSSYQKAAMASSVVLGQALPKPKPINPMMPKAGTIEPTTAEKAKFNQIFDAVQEPTSLLHEAAAGTLTRDQIDAVSATHPSILADMQKRVTQELKTLKEPLSPAQQASVKMLLGEPVFDHPIQPLPPPQPAGQTMAQNGGGKRPKSSTSRPLKLDVTGNVGLVGSRAERS